MAASDFTESEKAAHRVHVVELASRWRGQVELLKREIHALPRAELAEIRGRHEGPGDVAAAAGEAVDRARAMALTASGHQADAVAGQNAVAVRSAAQARATAEAASRGPTDAVARQAAAGASVEELADRVGESVQLSARRQAEAAEQARRATEEAARQPIRVVERIRQATDAPRRRHAAAAADARHAAYEPVRQALELTEPARMAVEGSAARMREHYDGLTRLLDHYDYARAVHDAAVAGSQAAKEISHHLPANWRSLGVDEVRKIVRLVRDDGVPLVWVPGVERTARAAEMATAVEVFESFLAERDEVLAEVEAALDEVTDPRLAVLTAKARSAVAALRDGHGDAAQALAAAVFTSAIHVTFASSPGDFDESGKPTAAPKPAATQTVPASYRTILVLQLAARYVQAAELAFPGFNRASTLHRIDAEQYTPVHHLAAVLAAAAVLREAQSGGYSASV